MKKIIDASDQIVGRISSTVAKSLMNGDEIIIINSEKAIVTGEPSIVMEKYKTKVDRGDPFHGPHYPKTPEGIMKRSIRGMIPYKKPKGRNAMKRLKTYRKNPKELKGKKIEKNRDQIECRFMSLGEISDKLRGL